MQINLSDLDFPYIQRDILAVIIAFLNKKAMIVLSEDEIGQIQTRVKEIHSSWPISSEEIKKLLVNCCVLIS